MVKVLVTRILPPQTQERLLLQGFELTQWQEDSAIPRNELLEKVKGKFFSVLFVYKLTQRKQESRRLFVYLQIKLMMSY